MLLADLDIAIEDIAPNPLQGWGVGRFSGRLGASRIDVSVYGRDASDAQLLAKTARFVFSRDSGPTLALTRRQQVEARGLPHDDGRTGRGPGAQRYSPPDRRARPVMRSWSPGPRPGRRSPPLRPMPRHPRWRRRIPTRPGVDGDGGGVPLPAPAPAAGRGTAGTPSWSSYGPILTEGALDSVFRQLQNLRAAGIAHGSLSMQTIVVDERRAAGFLDFRAASTVATVDQLNRDLAARWRRSSWRSGQSERWPRHCRAHRTEALVAALQYLQRAAALDSVAAKSLRGKKAVLTELRERGATAAGVEVPNSETPSGELGQPGHGDRNADRRMGADRGPDQRDQVWNTIAGADWAWVAVVFVLAQAAYPAIAITTVGLVTDPLPYGRTGRPRGGRHLRGPGRRIDGRARHQDPVLPAGGVHADRGGELRCPRQHSQFDREGRGVPRRPAAGDRQPGPR